ncbi:MAG TPA: RsmE family RNA methyltransferase [bacterium]|nr:RsmE family RNA methyltransferase [bacterium]
MRTARFFVPAEWIAKSAEAFCIPAGALHKQITTVLRMKVADPISLMVGDGEELEGHITEITKSAVMGVIASSKVSKPVLPEITVCAAMTKRDTFEWTLQKCTELGAVKFIPLLTDRVIKRPKDTPKRWLEIVKEAAEQSGRTTLPTLTEPLKLGEAMAYTEKCTRIFFHETGGAKLPKLHASSCIALFVGPEGGFTDQELALAHSAKAHIVTLGNLVLRAETAAIVGTTLLRFS